MKKESKKIKQIFKNIIYGIIIICMLYNICYFLNTTITNKEYFKVLGISFLNMNSDSMKPELNKNDLVVIKEFKQNFNNNDIIAYVFNGQVKISKIISSNFDNGKISYIMKANNNYYPEIEPVGEGQVIGIVIFNIPLLGFLLKILQAKITTVIVLVFLIFIFLYNRYTYLKSLERRRKKKHIRPVN